jgi:hypothetical protein
LAGDPNLAFTTAPVLLDEALVQQYEAELAAAVQIPLPDDGNDDFLA